MSDGSLETWLRGWRAKHPQLEPTWTFLRADPRRNHYIALAVLEQQWRDAVYAIREPQVAAAKLQWWREELQFAQAGAARHPLTQELFSEKRIRALPGAVWEEAMDAAMLALDFAPAADVAAQLAAARPLHGALARIEIALWFGAGVEPGRAEAVAAVLHADSLLRNFSNEIEYGRSPLPMSLLARHGLSVAGLSHPSAALNAALGDQMRALRQVLDETDKIAGPLSLLGDLKSRLDRRALRAASASSDPLQAFCLEQGGLRSLFDAWRAARTWHRAAQP